jgi:hypothetical protein
LSSSTGPSVLRSYGFNLTRNCDSRAIGLLQCSSKRFPTSCPKTIPAKDNLVSGAVVARASCYGCSPIALGRSETWAPAAYRLHSACAYRTLRGMLVG